MKQWLKILLVTWMAVMTAVLASKHLLPSSAPVMEEYNQLRAELAAKPEATTEEQQKLESLFLQLNVTDNIKEDVLGFVGKNALFFLVMLPLCFLGARHSGMDNNAILITAALIFSSFIVVKFFITGAALATAFTLGGIAFRKQPAQAQPTTASEE